MTVIPEPNLGPPPVQDYGLRPPDFTPVQEWAEEEGAPVEAPPAPQEDEVVETVLTDDERLLFSQLLTVGQRSKTIDVLGHSVVIQSLRVSDELRIGLMCKPYTESRMEQRAFQLGVCAAGIRTIDGVPLYQSLTSADTDDAIFDRKVKALENYYPVVLTKIYRAVMDLDQEFVELAVKLGKLEG